MNVRGKNPTGFQGTGNREQRIGKSFKSFIYLLKCRNRFRTAIAISYTLNSFQVQKIKNKGVQEYISRTNEKRRKERRHSSFFVGLSTICWAINYHLIWELVKNFMSQNRYKLLYYRRGLKEINRVVNQTVIFD